jgi:hypothetical protein
MGHEVHIDTYIDFIHGCMLVVCRHNETDDTALSQSTMARSGVTVLTLTLVARPSMVGI